MNRIEPFQSKVWLSSPTMHGDEQKWVNDAFAKNWITTAEENINEVERMIAGFAFLATYNHPVIRYSLVAAALVMIFIFRNQIIRTIKQVMNVKKNKNA